MICKRCFKMSDDGEKYCPYCGKSFTDDSEIDVSKKENEEKEEKEQNEQNEQNTDSETPRFSENGNGAMRPEPINMFGREYSYPPKREMSPFKKTVSALIHAICYVVLFLILQSTVASFFMTAEMVSASTEYMEKYYAESGVDINAMTDEEYMAFVNSMTEELSAVMMASAYDIDVNAVSAVTALAVIFVLFIMSKIKRRTFSEHVGFYPISIKKWHFWLVVPAGIALNCIIIFILSILPLSDELIQSYNELYAFIGSSPLWLEILAVGVCAPVVEEFIFRGCVHSRLRRAMKPLPAAIISAFLFGIVHGHIIAAAYAFTLGLMLSYLYERYNTVIVPILFHMAFNMTNYIPVMREDAGDLEIIITFAVSLVIAAVSAVIIHRSTNKITDSSSDDNTEEN